MTDKAVYSNKFTIALSDVVRITFIDEKSRSDNLPMPSYVSSEIIMTIDNFRKFIDLGKDLIRKIS